MRAGSGRSGSFKPVSSLLILAAFWMLQSIKPELDGIAFGTALAVLGIAMGLIASQLGSVIQSSVGAEGPG